MNILRVRKDLAAIAFYAERVMPDDNGNRLILADGVDTTAGDALRLIDALIGAIKNDELVGVIRLLQKEVAE